MKKYLSLLLSLLLQFAALAQTVPDTTTLEGKARYNVGRIRDNSVRAITPKDFRNAFNSVIDLSLAKVVDLQTSLPQKNIANPENFVAGKLMTSSGTEVVSATITHSGKLPVTEGLQYSGHTISNGMRYGTFYNSSNQVIPGGWDTEWRITFTAPPGAAWFIGSFTGGETFQFEEGLPTDIIPYGVAVSREIKIPAADVLQDASNRMVADADKTAWNKVVPLAAKFTKVNLANPAQFVAGYALTSTGATVTAATFTYSGKMPVVPGLQYTGRTTSNGMRYGAFYNASNQIVAGGFDGVWTFTVTAPPGAAYFVGTFTGSEAATFRFVQGTDASLQIPYTHDLTSNIAVPSADVLQDATHRFVTDTEKASWNQITSYSYLSQRFKDLEYRGFLPPRSMLATSPIADKVAASVSKLRKKDADFTVGVFDGSASTDMGYCAKYSNEPYLPPLLTDQNIIAEVERTLRRGYDSQQWRRYDSMADVAGSTPTFTEVGTGTTTNNDHAWDYQYSGTWPTVPNYNGLTRILTGSAPAVTFYVRDAHPRCDFIYRTDYLSSAALKVTVADGNGVLQAYDETTSTWVEANNYTFSAKEVDEILATTFNTSSGGPASGLRKTIFQKRLKLRRVSAANTSGSKGVTITSTDGGRLCYWGIQYSRKMYMLNFINMARGSHSINSLHALDAWQIDYWKPDLIVYPLNTMNEGAIVSTPTSTDSPVAFAGRFKTYVEWMLAKPWNPDVIGYISFASRNQGIVDSGDRVNHTYISGYGTATFFDYIDTTVDQLKTLETGRFAIINAFYEYYNTAKAIKEVNGGFLYNIMHGPTGTIPTDPNSDYFTTDGTHQNTRGSEIGKRVITPYFRF